MIKKLLILISLTIAVNGFYLPGLAPVTYCPENMENCKVRILLYFFFFYNKYFIIINFSFQSDIILYVNRLNTDESILPFEYHHFDFCQGDESNSPAENLGQVVFGERIRPGPYKIEFNKSMSCVKVCTKSYTGGDPVSEKKLVTLKKGISLNYKHHWIVDNMPVTWCYTFVGDQQYCNTGFPMGCLARQDGVNIF